MPLNDRPRRPYEFPVKRPHDPGAIGTGQDLDLSLSWAPTFATLHYLTGLLLPTGVQGFLWNG